MNVRIITGFTIAAALGAGLGNHAALACPPESESGGAAAQSTVALTALDDQTAEPRHVDLALCLDTSGSMDGLINAARQKLWAVVNDLALAKPTPKFRVALLTYGNDGHDPQQGWVTIDVPFTDDLDLVSQKLFALKTNGGTELVGRVVNAAAAQLDWTPSDDALKLIIVAGNESADQDQEVSFRNACRNAIGKGVMVNSIYCRYQGDGNGIEDGWREVAKLADGQYASIDQNNTTVVIATPFDDALISLSGELNRTYIPFGSSGEAGWLNQQAQDDNAASLNKATAAARAQTKGGALYGCSWDLVDACRMQQIDLATVKEEDLPENMRAMTPEERQKYVDEMQARRAEVQKKIEATNADREKLVFAEQRRQSVRGVDQFDLVIRNALSAQAKAKGLDLPAVDLAAAHAVEGAALPYFVQLGSEWVSAGFADEFERLRTAQTPVNAKATIAEKGAGYDALLAKLAAPEAAALRSIEEGSVYVKIGAELYAVTMVREPVEAPNPAVIGQVGQSPQTVQQQLLLPPPPPAPNQP